HDRVTRPEIKRAEDLRGKRIGVTSIGGTAWMACMLGLEHLGLHPEKDNLVISGYGDMRVTTQALESGTIDGGLISGHFSLRLKRIGVNLLGDLERIPLMGHSLGVEARCLESNMELMRGAVRAMGDGQGCVGRPANKIADLRILSKRMGISDAGLLEGGCQELVRRLDKKPDPAIE